MARMVTIVSGRASIAAANQAQKGLNAEALLGGRTLKKNKTSPSKPHLTFSSVIECLAAVSLRLTSEPTF